MRKKFGKSEFNFMPLTFMLPADRFNFWVLNNGFLKSVVFRKKIIRYMAKHQEQFWIVKPPNLFCGMGIRVVNKFLDIPNKKSQLCVQNYIRNQEITCDANT